MKQDEFSENLEGNEDTESFFIGSGLDGFAEWLNVDHSQS